MRHEGSSGAFLHTIPMDEKLPRHLHGLRRTAFTDLEKDFYKLMSNAVFGKIMKNVHNRLTLRWLKVEDLETKLLTAVAKISLPEMYPL